MTAETEIKEIVTEEAGSQAEAKRVFQQAAREPFPFNENYRLNGDDLRTLLEFAETTGATNADVRQWYANGLECRDRPGVIASFHPLIHKREGEWPRIHQMAKSLAMDLGRWIWLTLGEDRWVRLMTGPDPAILEREEQPNPLLVNGKYQNDQFITTFSPAGLERFIGCS